MLNMKEELDELFKQMEEELDNIKIEAHGGFNNKANKPYWDLEKKYKEKAKKIREKYEGTSK